MGATCGFASRLHANPETRLTMPPDTPPPVVVWASHPHAQGGGMVQQKAIGSMLDAAIVELTERPQPDEAWRSLFTADDIIGIKFNRSGAEILGTTPTFAAAILKCLSRAGLALDRVVLIEAPENLEGRDKCRAAVEGYDREPTSFGSGSDELASVLSQITALVNVPFLKTHNMTGMTCALKNLSHGLIKHPARFHENGCSPYIGDIVALAAIRGKLRLNLVNALRIIVEGGPEGSRESVAAPCSILASKDPVACDTLGLQLLNDARDERGIEPIASNPAQLPYLAHAHRLGLGIAITSGIRLIRLEM